MTRKRLRVIPQPEPRTRIVLVVSDDGLRGEGDLDLLCGVCDETLAAGVPDERLERFRSAVVEEYARRGGVRISGGERALVLRCPTCGAYNEAGDEGGPGEEGEAGDEGDAPA